MRWERHAAGEVWFKPHATYRDHASSPVTSCCESRCRTASSSSDSGGDKVAGSSQQREQTEAPLEDHMDLFGIQIVEQLLAKPKHPKIVPHLNAP